MTGRLTRRARLLALVMTPVVAGGCGISLQSLPKIGGVGGQTYPIHAVFQDVLNLPANAQVRTGAEVVGEVGSISAHDFVADVTLQIKRGVRLPQGTQAQVRFDNPLGDEYVLLEPPLDAATAPAMAPGAVIPEVETSTAPSVEQTLGALSLFLNGGGINQLQVIIHELNNTFSGNQPQIRELLSTINGAVTTLASGTTPVDNALTALSNLSQTLNGPNGSSAKTIGTGVASISSAVAVLAKENSSIDGLVDSLDNLGQVGSAIADQAGQQGVDDLKDLLPVVNQLNSVSSQLGPDLSDLSTFEAVTPKVAPGDYLQVSVVADVILPPGDFTASPSAADASAAKASGGPLRGAQAVSTLLAGGAL
jgi:phospholipid/cholesterol/gamma-HCH transport system substrate-binding protein